MKLLLDTHIWLWAIGQPKRLNQRVAGALKSQRNELWLSPVSTWEALTLIDAGKVRVDRNAAEYIERAFVDWPVQQAPVTHEIAIATRAVSLPHNDPADRFIAATARVLDLTLVTADKKLIAGRGYKLLAND